MAFSAIIGLLRHLVLGKLQAANVLQDSKAMFKFGSVKKITEQARSKVKTTKKGLQFSAR